MNLDHYLSSVELLDCDGRVSHTLTLGLDGTVSVRFRTGHIARIDPHTRTVLTANVTVSAALLDQACRLTLQK